MGNGIKAPNDQPARGDAASDAAQRCDDAEELAARVATFLQLFNEQPSLEEYLDAVVRRLREWSGCRHIAIRVLNEQRQIPFLAHAGLSDEFCARESCLSLDRDTCACVRVAAGTPEPQDLAHLTAAGSFLCNDTFDFIESLTEAERRRFRGVCVEAGYRSLAVVPIRYHSSIIGAIQIADENPESLSPGVMRFVETMAPLVGEAIHRFRLEHELLKMQKLESLGLLAGGIAHDFNNLLTGILGQVTLARVETDAGTGVHSRLAAAERGIERAQYLAQQLLTFAHGETPARRRAPLGEIVHETVSLSLASAKSAAEVDVPPELWPTEADADQLSRVIQNLLINADQAMPEGGTVRVRVQNMMLSDDNTLSLPAGPYLRVEVSDQGVGIPREHLGRIFDPYFTTKPNGNGLGLATSFAITRKHGGSIAVESTPGAGSTFYVYLPASAAAPADEPRVAVDRPARVLLMDDEEIVRETMAEMVRYFGHDAETAANGEEAVEAFRLARDAGRPFDAVILDLIVRHGMGGSECLERLREIDAGVRAVAISGDAITPIMVSHRDFGFAASLTKPASLAALERVLQQVLGR